jgi:hypothetical protein
MGKSFPDSSDIPPRAPSQVSALNVVPSYRGGLHFAFLPNFFYFGPFLKFLFCFVFLSALTGQLVTHFLDFQFL